MLKISNLEKRFPRSESSLNIQEYFPLIFFLSSLLISHPYFLCRENSFSLLVKICACYRCKSLSKNYYTQKTIAHEKFPLLLSRAEKESRSCKLRDAVRVSDK